MATPITLDEATAEITASVNMTNMKDTVDLYKLPLSATGTYTVYMELLDGSTYSYDRNAYIKMYSSNNEELITTLTPYAKDVGNLDTAADWVRETFEVGEAGDYYIIIGREDNIDANYKFSITAP